MKDQISLVHSKSSKWRVLKCDLPLSQATVYMRQTILELSQHLINSRAIGYYKV